MASVEGGHRKGTMLKMKVLSREGNLIRIEAYFVDSDETYTVLVDLSGGEPVIIESDEPKKGVKFLYDSHILIALDRYLEEGDIPDNMVSAWF